MVMTPPCKIVVREFLHNFMEFYIDCGIENICEWDHNGKMSAGFSLDRHYQNHPDNHLIIHRIIPQI